MNNKKFTVNKKQANFRNKGKTYKPTSKLNVKSIVFTPISKFQFTKKKKLNKAIEKLRNKGAEGNMIGNFKFKVMEQT